MFFRLSLIFISIIIIGTFFFVDWDKIAIEDFIERSNINLSPAEYEYEYE